jgi:YidC/Oxa1 family membrane protein insertase
MGDEKRFVLFLILTMLVVVLTQPLYRLVFGPPKPDARAAKEADTKRGAAEEQADKPAAKGADKKAAEAPAVGEAKGAEERPAPAPEPDRESRTLGSIDPAAGFKMQVQFTNHGAAVERIELAEFESEDRKGQLALMSTIGDESDSFLLGLKGASAALEKRNWKIVDEPVNGDAPADAESIRFQTTLDNEMLVVTKTYRLTKGSYTLGLEIEITNRSDRDQTVTYRLGGPRGFVLEGAWFATKKREAAIAIGSGGSLKRHAAVATSLVKGMESIRKLADKSGGVIRRDQWHYPSSAFDRFDDNHDERLSGDEVTAAAHHLAGSEDRYSERPVRYAGVDSQFFCALLVVPSPGNLDERWDAVTTPILVSRDRRYPDRSDVSVEVESKPFDLSAGDTLRHSYTVYAGPRRERDLLELQDAAIVRSIKDFRWALFIPPGLVSLTAGTMLYVLQTFHELVRNWGVAIMMLTVLVRLCLFPLSRKQAIRAQVMQQKMATLKPELDKIKAKYKDNLQESQRVQFELMKKHGVDPRSQLAGCLPLLIQMPIFIGLWQGLQSTVDLRLARFLWIDNLAAPDGPSIPFFHWGENIPLVSWLLGPYFNLLPCILIGLMLVQQKLFMPPKADPPDPQVEMQQKMMTYMMVMFGAFFWKLPSGLCLYYICSTSWGIAERKLLPKLQHATPDAAGSPEKSTESNDRKGHATDRDGRGSGRDGKDKRPQARQQPTLADRLSELLKKADKR